MIKGFFLPPAFCILLMNAYFPAATAQVQQHKLSRVEEMTDFPQPFQIIDFLQLAQKFDRTVFDFKATGKYWPLVCMDTTNKNFPQPVVGVYTAIADVRQGPDHNHGMFHEALANMGSVLGASLVGIDKRRGIDYVGMLKNYFNKESGWNIMMNNTCPDISLLGGGYGRDWWYDVYPNVLFYAICDFYPDEPGFDTIAHRIAEKFYLADSILSGDYYYSFFDYGKMKPMKNNICEQPDAAAGHAYVLYAAYKKYDDRRYFDGALSALAALQSNEANPSYEVLMPFGAYLAARINAEEGTKYDLNKMLEWSFDGTAACREGWGILTGNWNGIDISGIVGSTSDHGGYGFLMNTYDAAIPLIPLVRYDQSYAGAIGKWMLNAANAAKLFYPQYMPEDHQTLPGQAAVTKGVIGYEGIIYKSSYKEHEDLKAPVAQGDGPTWVPGKNPDLTQFSVYGSAHAGIFGGIIRPTGTPGLLQLNLLATDFYHDKAYPSYLYYNPYKEEKTVTISLPKKRNTDLYNTVTGKFIARNLNSSGKIKIPSREAVIIVCVPSGGKQTYERQKMMINGIVVDYHFSRQKN
jgi:hypothetical protein